MQSSAEIDNQNNYDSIDVNEKLQIVFNNLRTS